MKITVVTVSFNAEESIAATMESLLLQQPQPGVEYEYLILDGASTDGTLEVVKQYQEKLKQAGFETMIYSEPDHGIYNAMNKGASKATGDVIGFLNCGDLYEKNTLQIVADTFRNTDCDLMFGNIRIQKENGSSFVKKARLRSFQTSRDWNHPTMFVKTALLQAYPFQEKGIHDDYGFYLQMVKQKRKIVTVDREMALFCMGGASNRKNLKEAVSRIRDRYQYCYRVNGYSRFYLIECILIESAKMILG